MKALLSKDQQSAIAGGVNEIVNPTDKEKNMFIVVVTNEDRNKTDSNIAIISNITDMDIITHILRTVSEEDSEIFVDSIILMETKEVYTDKEELH